MPTSKVAKRYATGLLDFTQGTGNTETVFGEMKEVAATLGNSKELTALYNSPFIDAKKKISISDQIFNGLSKTCRNMVALVIKQGRESFMREICEAYVDKVETLNGVQKVSLTLATPLSQDNIQRILESSHLVDGGKSSDLKIMTKPEILGGYILRVGDQQVDDSVRTQLIGIRKKFNLN